MSISMNAWYNKHSTKKVKIEKNSFLRDLFQLLDINHIGHIEPKEIVKMMIGNGLC